MPELPEVETVVRTLIPRVVGRAISSVELLRPDILHPPGIDLPAVLSTHRIIRIDRRGKKILIRLDASASLCIHLGMTGRLLIESPDHPRRKHTHVILHFDDSLGRDEIRFSDPRRFGGVWYLCDGSPGDENLGPEPLTITPASLAKRLSKTRRAIKSALLDQHLIAGLGNIYVDEALFESHIHPLRPAHRLSLDQIRRLTRAIKLVLRRAIRSRGSSLRDYVDAEGLPGDFQKLHRVYARENKPCVRCSTPLHRIVLGGRSTHFCPTCQPRRSSR